MVTLHIITPHGGSTEDLLRTAASLLQLRLVLQDVQIKWVIILNNNTSIDKNVHQKIDNLDGVVLDINPIACRSTARNRGVSALSNLGVEENDYVMFLDSGDMIEQQQVMELPLMVGKDCIIGAALVESDKGCHVRRQPSLNLIRIINPIYLGTGFVKYNYVKKMKFHRGRKEDWKFWIELFELKPKVIVTNKIAYRYTIKSKIDHSRRKLKLFVDQWNFFRSYLKFGIIRSAVHFMLHYTVNAYRWLRL